MPPVVAVIGGTPQDTRLGAAVLRGLVEDIYLLERPAAQSPRAQTLFQNAPAEEKEQFLRQLLAEVQADGGQGAYVYCNSLSGAADLPALAAELGLPLVTPLPVYAAWAAAYRHLGIWAANAAGQTGIERTLLGSNPQLRLAQFSNLDLVEAVEHGWPARETVERFRLAELSGLFAALGAEAIVLGCTHFREFKSSLAPHSPLPLLDPAEEMWRLLEAQLSHCDSQR